MARALVPMMPPGLRRIWLLAHKLPGKPPSLVARRLLQEVRRQISRPYTRLRPRWLTETRLLAQLGQTSIDAGWRRLSALPVLIDPCQRERFVAAFEAQFPHDVPTVVAQAEALCRHEFDLLGSGRRSLGWPLPWHDDFIAGRRWPVHYAGTMPVDELDRPSDVKVPWELSRCQHFARLGQAYWLTGEERFAEEIARQVDDWIARNPWGYGVNWICTMDVALRAVSWVWAIGFVGGSAAWADRDRQSRLLRSLWLHGEHIAAHLETSDVNGNHLLADAVGLVVVGALFRDSATGRAWIEQGRRIVVAEIEAQVHEDGVNHEQAVAYHRLVAECCLTALLVLRRCDRDVPAAAWARIERMCDYVACYTRPDGRAPALGDADDGRVQKLGTQDLADHRYLAAIGAALFGRADLKAAAGDWPDEAFWLLGPAARQTFDALPTGAAPASRAFPDGGIYIIRHTDTHVIIDAAEVGLRGRGGHGHNDVLSFELVLGGLPLIVDPGTFVYTASAQWRHRFRSTAYHNTVQVDGAELNRLRSSDDLWSLRYDAVPGDIVWLPGADVSAWAASHRGYARLPDPVVHRRAVVVDGRLPALLLKDRLTGGASHQLQSRLHLARDVDVHLDNRLVRLVRRHDGAQAWLQLLHADGAVGLSVETGWVSPSYGIKHETAVLVLGGTCQLPTEMTMLISRSHPREIDDTAMRRRLEAMA